MATRIGGKEAGGPAAMPKRPDQAPKEKVLEEEVDVSSADSFPASDPPAFTAVTRTGQPKDAKRQEQPAGKPPTA